MEFRIFHHHNQDSEVLREVRELRELVKSQGEQIMIDVSKLQAEDAVLAQDITDLTQAVKDEAVTIQTSIDNLAKIQSTDPAVQAAIDAEVANLTTAASNITAATAAVKGLPTTPTPPAPTA